LVLVPVQLFKTYLQLVYVRVNLIYNKQQPIKHVLRDSYLVKTLHRSTFKKVMDLYLEIWIDAISGKRCKRL